MEAHGRVASWLIALFGFFVYCCPTGSEPLNLALGDHLLAEVVLVLSNGAVPTADGLVFTDHNVLSNLVKKSADKLAL
jgi:hypothetical protein